MNQIICEMRSRNIKFECINECHAIEIMKTEYPGAKLLSYASLFDQYQKTEKKGQFIELDFAYLYDLAEIDSLLQKIVMCMCIDIEQKIKTMLIADTITVSNPENLVKEFVTANHSFFSSVYHPDNMDTQSKQQLKDKPLEEASISTFLDIIHFGTLQRFARFFYSRYAEVLYAKGYAPFEPYLDEVRKMRNAAAHNSGLINQLVYFSSGEIVFIKNPYVLSFLGKNGISHRTLSTNTSKSVVHDFCCLLHMYVCFETEEKVKRTLQDLSELFKERCTAYKSYYRNNSMLMSVYNFLLDVIDVYKKRNSLTLA